VEGGKIFPAVSTAFVCADETVETVLTMIRALFHRAKATMLMRATNNQTSGNPFAQMGMPSLVGDDVTSRTRCQKSLAGQTQKLKLTSQTMNWINDKLASQSRC
jgi:hypothetical protein